LDIIFGDGAICIHGASSDDVCSPAPAVIAPF
jgi:hypothetical protein